MSRCSLSIELLDPDAPRRPGDVVQGLVRVEVDRAVQCRALKAILRVKTTGRGNTWRQDAQELALYEGEWAPGDDLVYPIELTVPNGPVTYHGKLLNVIWQVYATVDIPWAFDPEAEQEILVLAGSEPASTGPGGASAAIEAMHPALLAIRLPRWLPLVIVPEFLLLVGVGVVWGGSPFLLFLLFVGLTVVQVGGFVGFHLVRNQLAERRLGQVEVALSSAELLAGEALSATVHIAPPAPVALRRATLRLTAEERVVRGSGSNRSTYTHPVFEQEAVLHVGGTVFNEVTWSGSIALPDDAAPSFAATDNELVWRALVRIDVPRWPDFVHTETVTVRPRAGP